MKKSFTEQKDSTKPFSTTSLGLDLLVNSKDELQKEIEELGFKQKDNHLKREVAALPGHFKVFKDRELIDFIKKEKSLPKFKLDWVRMYRYFKKAVEIAKKDPNSRQLMVLNGSNFYRDLPCFTHFQFVMTHRGEYDMYVYQRSSDLEKYVADMVFFGDIMKKFEGKVGIPVTKLVVIYGNIHYETKS